MTDENLFIADGKNGKRWYEEESAGCFRKQTIQHTCDVYCNDEVSCIEVCGWKEDSIANEENTTYYRHDLAITGTTTTFNINLCQN